MTFKLASNYLLVGFGNLFIEVALDSLFIYRKYNENHYQVIIALG